MAKKGRKGTSKEPKKDQEHIEKGDSENPEEHNEEDSTNQEEHNEDENAKIEEENIDDMQLQEEMGKVVFPTRMFSLDDHPYPRKSITYHSGRRELLNALQDALPRDEWEELRLSHLGVLVKFHELDFGWASRLVHYMLSAQLFTNKPYELWTLVGDQPMRFSLYEFRHLTELNCDYVENVDKPSVKVTDEIKEFWKLLGVSVDTGPTYNELVQACGRCHRWEREDRIKLGFLALYVNFIEARSYTTPCNTALARLVIDPKLSPQYPWGRLAHKLLMKSVKVAELPSGSYTIDGFAQVLHVWILYALPAFGKKYGEPVPDDPTPPLIAFNGSRARKNFIKNMQAHTVVRNFIRYEFDDMFPFWEDDVGDDKVVNILRAMYGHFGAWEWNDSHWPAKGVLVALTKVVAVTAKREAEVKIEGDVKRVKQEADDGAGDDEMRAEVDGTRDLMEDGFSQMAEGISKLADLIKESFVDVHLKMDFILHRVDGLARDVEDVKNKVDGNPKQVQKNVKGIGNESQEEVKKGLDAEEVEKNVKGIGNESQEEVKKGLDAEEVQKKSSDKEAALKTYNRGIKKGETKGNVKVVDAKTKKVAPVKGKGKKEQEKEKEDAEIDESKEVSEKEDAGAEAGEGVSLDNPNIDKQRKEVVNKEMAKTVEPKRSERLVARQKK